MHTPTPGLPEFDYVKPASLAEATNLLAQLGGAARPFMGGTDTFVRLRDGVWQEKVIVDVKHLAGMNDISFDLETGLTLGAAVNMNRVITAPEVTAHYPLLAQAAQTVASYQLRTRATIVGNICNGSPAGDTTGACIVLGGMLHVHGVDGWREEPLDGFFLGPGWTVLNPGDVVTAITFPPPPENHAARYIKLARNARGDLAIVGVTALGYPDRHAPSGFRFRLALASVAPIPLVPVEAETILTQGPVNDTTIAAAAQAAMEACHPIDDARGSACYRRLMVRNLTQRALTEVWREISGQ
ncbi:MAG TPA: xanthine dehydrogenase family protein subunit M [Anaerolineae bacterium]